MQLLWTSLYGLVTYLLFQLLLTIVNSSYPFKKTVTDEKIFTLAFDYVNLEEKIQDLNKIR